MATFEEQQAKIDKLFNSTKADPLRAQRLLLELGKLGAEAPEALTRDEIRKVCEALVVHFHQMGIGEPAP